MNDPLTHDILRAARETFVSDPILIGTFKTRYTLDHDVYVLHDSPDHDLADFTWIVDDDQQYRYTHSIRMGALHSERDTELNIEYLYDNGSKRIVAFCVRVAKTDESPYPIILE